MTCPAFQISPRGRQGIGVNQPQGGLDYPFVAPADVADAHDIRYLVADFYLSYDDPGLYNTDVPETQHPLRIQWLYGVGCETVSKPSWAPNPAHDADIQIVDANDNVVFDSTQLAPIDGDYQSYTKRAWGADYDIHEWIGNDGVCRIVVYKTWPESFPVAPRNWPTHFVPLNAVLDERAVYKMPRRVRSLRFVDHGVVLDRATRSGVTLAGGNNMAISAAAAPASARNATLVTFDATPGAGAGKYNNCSVTPSMPIYRLNGLAPNKYGDFLIAAPDCVWIRQPTTIHNGRATPVPFTLAIGSDCPPCCDCPDYVELAKYMNRVQARYALIGQRAHEVKLLHEQNIARWLASRDCRLQTPIKLLLVPQYCPTMDVVMMYCNQCLPCANNTTLSVTFETFPAGGTAEVVCGHTTMTAPGVGGQEFKMTGSWPTYTATFPAITLGNSGYVQFRLKFTPSTTAYSVTGTITGTTNGEPIRANCAITGSGVTVSETQTLNCRSDGQTITHC